MTGEQIMAGEDFNRCAQFHGHVCPGLSIGYRAAKVAMAKLEENRARDEEIVAVMETDACCADAVQVLTGCTFGKGNFVYKDYGKVALTLFSRSTGKGVRLSMQPGIFEADNEHSALLQKVMCQEADEREQARFNELHHQRSLDILEMEVERLFKVEDVTKEMPPTAHMAPSQPCDQCGEPTMQTKLEQTGEKKVCRACFASLSGQS